MSDLLDLVREDLRPQVRRVMELSVRLEAMEADRDDETDEEADARELFAEFFAEATVGTCAALAAQIKTVVQPEIAIVKAELKRLQGRKETLERREEQARSSLGQLLDHLGETKFEHAGYSGYRRRGSLGVAQVDPDVTPDMLPDDLTKQAAPTFDKTAIGNALKKGERVLGFERRRSAPSLVVK